MAHATELAEVDHGGPSAETSRSPWCVSIGALLRELGSSPDGLSEAEADARAARFGPNALSSSERPARWRVLLAQFTSPLIYVLLAACAVTIVVGLHSDAMIIAIVLVLNATMGYVQEQRAERAMAALMGIVAARATVVRDGRRREIASEELVPGDIVVLEAGQLVPADVRVVTATRLRVDESLLTGESAPSEKFADALDDERLGVGERSNMCFSGTAIVTGHGRALVTAIGVSTELGSIAEEIRSVRRNVAPIQERVRRLARRLTAVVLVASVILFVAGLLQRRAVFEMFLTAVATAVSVIPEGLPIVMTVALSVGVRRMARRNAIVRRLAAVETLGSCTVILTDKTGTLTENRLTVERLLSDGEDYRFAAGEPQLQKGILHDGRPVWLPPDSPARAALAAGVLANEATVVVLDEEHGEIEIAGDPVDCALHVAAWKGGVVRASLLEELSNVAEMPFDPDRRYAGGVFRNAGGELLSFVKGAPECIASMCGSVMTSAGEIPIDREAIHDVVATMAAEGQRVLALADGRGECAADALIGARPDGLRFLGLVGMLDPPRPQARDAVRACRDAGIRVVMVTGDHASTAESIARDVGILEKDSPVLSGAQLDDLGDHQLNALLRDPRVLARMSPPQKLRIVRLLKAGGDIVAVTGDGVNDAPALKAAHIGAAMGRYGTDVAREAADIVLTDDNFATIFAAVAEGRAAFANIRNATYFLVASGVGELLLIVSAILAGLPLPLLPAQILWLNVVTNGIQDVALALEPPEPGTLRQPPRPPAEGILSRALVVRSGLVGSTLAIVGLTVFLVELNGGASLAYSQVAALTALVVCEFVQVGSSRSETMSIFTKGLASNRPLLFGSLLSILVHVAALYWTPSRRLLSLEPLSVESWAMILSLSISVAIVAELHKWRRRVRL